MDNPYITLAIHTYDYAVELRRILESNGVAARLENVDLHGNSASSGVRVRIPSSDLPLALKIVENSIAISPAMACGGKGVGDKVLIPVDFSGYSYLACAAGFAFASLLGVEAVILNVFASPYFDGNIGNTDGLSIEIADAKMQKSLEDAAKIEMRRLSQRLRKEIIAGTLPPVKFSTEILEGVPEDAIMQYARSNPPMLIVMATRGTHKKASQMIGSVAAEIIDSCRLPVFTVPENFTFTSFEAMKEVIFFCNIDQQDLLAMDVFMRLLHSCPLHVHLVPVSDRVGSSLRSRLDALERYCREHYPAQSFTSAIIPKDSFRSDMETYIQSRKISMLVVPNKKKNAFSRLFNPGIAHRIIFEKDIPMLALPV